MPQFLKVNTIEEVQRRGYGHYDIIEIPLNVAHNDYIINTGFFNTLIFKSVPQKCSIKLTEKENGAIDIETAIKVWQEEPFRRIYLSNDAYATTDKIILIVGYNLDLSFVNIKPDLKELAVNTTPLGTNTTPYTSDAYSVSDFGEIVINCFSDVEGTIRVEFSYDSINWDVLSESYPIDANIGKGIVQEIKGKYVRFVFEKVTPSENQTIFRLSAFARS